MKLINKDALVAEIENIEADAICQYKSDKSRYAEGGLDVIHRIKHLLDTLEVKDVVVEQEGVCNSIFNRIIGDNWNLSIPLDKVGLKHGDKVKIFVTKENKL